mgnify:CR=1 FL=1
MTNKYKISFDIWALLLFLIIMAPNFIWYAFPAPNDILRADSVTQTVDSITSVLQVLMIIAMCMLKNTESKKLSATPLIIGSGLCCLLYYISWLAYYNGFVGAFVILGLTLPPSIAFLLYAIDRKNQFAVILSILFTVGHTIYAVANFIL